jgi:hypothetical protein
MGISEITLRNVFEPPHVMYKAGLCSNRVVNNKQQTTKTNKNKQTNKQTNKQQ